VSFRRAWGLAAALAAGAAWGCSSAQSANPPSATTSNSGTQATGDAGASATGTLPTGCGPAGKSFACNPVTNGGCTSGQECDDDQDGGFTCYPPPNDGTEGSACNDVTGPSCAGGMACRTQGTSASGVCARYCCGATDCAVSQQCVAFDGTFGTLGFCQ
jgi:hypothetical protein